MGFETLMPFAIVAIVAAVIGLMVGYVLLGQRVPDPSEPSKTETTNPLRFVFENGLLTQADPEGLKLLSMTSAQTITWPDVYEALSERLDDLPKVLSETQDPVLIAPLEAHPNEPRAILEQTGVFTRLTLMNMGNGTDGLQVTPKAALGLAALTAPFPIWQTDETGKISWKNKKFDAFGFPDNPLVTGQATSHHSHERLSVTDPLTQEFRHFDVLSQNLLRGKIYYGLNADCAVKAETIRREFVQTLAKTFAQLSTGIAVFDNGPRLVLFNPALTDIFGLSAEFLSTRPTLQALFDHMRENRMIPEPRDYVSWREQLTNLILGASEGKYRENWQLPSGETIRVTGQSHPEGALGFLFEDITAEITLSRRFKEDVSRAYGLMDAQPDPMVAINQQGVVFFANKAFKTYWKTDPESSFADFTAADLISLIEPGVSSHDLATLRMALSGPTLDQPVILPGHKADLHVTAAEGKIRVLTQKLRIEAAQPVALKNPAE